MADKQARLAAMVERLRQEGHRITPQRLAVLRILAASQGHPSVEQIHERVRADFPTTSLATIYKTVTLLRQLGEVLELGFGHDASRYDGRRPYPHPHLICLKCGEILDPDLAGLTEIPQVLAQQTGYRVLDHRLDFFGLCPRCQKQD